MTMIDFGAAAEAGAHVEQPVQQAATMHHPELITQTQEKTAPAAINPYDLMPVRDALAPYEDAIAAMQAEADSIVITDEASAEKAVEIASRAKKAGKNLEAARKAFVADPNSYVKEVNGITKYYAEKLAVVEKGIGAKHAVYQRAVEAERRRLEEEAHKEAERLRRAAEEEARKAAEEAKAKGEEPPAPVQVEITAPAVPKTDNVVRSQAGTAHVRQEWKFAIEDASAVPREYLTVDERAIREAVKNGVREIPGMRVYQETKTIFRTN